MNLPYSKQQLMALREEREKMPRPIEKESLNLMPEGEDYFRELILRIIEKGKYPFQLKELADFENRKGEQGFGSNSNPHRIIFQIRRRNEDIFSQFIIFVRKLCKKMEKWHFTHNDWGIPFERKILREKGNYHRTILIPDPSHFNVAFRIEIKRPEGGHDYTSKYFDALSANAHVSYKRERDLISQKKRNNEEFIILPTIPEIHLHILIDKILNYEGIFELYSNPSLMK